MLKDTQGCPSSATLKLYNTTPLLVSAIPSCIDLIHSQGKQVRLGQVSGRKLQRLYLVLDSQGPNERRYSGFLHWLFIQSSISAALPAGAIAQREQTVTSIFCLGLQTLPSSNPGQSMVINASDWPRPVLLPLLAAGAGADGDRGKDKRV